MHRSTNTIAFAGLLLFTALPVTAGLGYALCYSFGLSGALNNGFTTQHWQALFAEGSLPQSLVYSAVLAVVAVALSVALAMLVALRHHRRFYGSITSYLVYLPLAFPPIVAAFFFLQLLSGAGILSRIGYAVGLVNSPTSFPGLVNDQWGIGIIAAHFFLCFPVFLLLFISRIKTERLPAFMMLSASLGAGHKQSMYKVAVPMLLQKTAPNILLYTLFIFGSYEIPILLGRSNPEMVSVLAVRKLQKFNLLDIPQGYAVAIVYTLLVLAIILLVFRQTKKAHAR